VAFRYPLSTFARFVCRRRLDRRSYFHLQGWGLLLVTTPLAVIPFLASRMLILAGGKRNCDKRRNQTAASDYYAWIKSILFLLRQYQKRETRAPMVDAAKVVTRAHLFDHRRCSPHRGDFPASCARRFCSAPISSLRRRHHGAVRLCDHLDLRRRAHSNQFARQSGWRFFVALALAAQVGPDVLSSGKNARAGLPVLTAAAAEHLPPIPKSGKKFVQFVSVTVRDCLGLVLVAMIGAVVMAKKRR